MEFLRTNIILDRTSATEVYPKDLPINPLSHLIVTMDGFNVTDEGTLAELLAFINTITVTHSGKVVYGMQSEDAYAQNCYLFGNRPVLTGKLVTDNLNRSLSLIIPFGRKLYNPEECYPATRKGELTLTLDLTALATSWDNGVLNVDAVELPGATPQRYLKSTLQTISAPGKTGPNDIGLPIGNQIVAMCVRMTSWYAAAASTLGVEYVQTLVNNQQFGIAYAKSQCLIGENILLFDTQHGAIAAQGLIQPAHCMFVDFDPNKDGQFFLETEGKSSVTLRLDMGVDEATNLSIYELVKV